jgi:mono/diheme cytochrome c family protein
MFREHGVFDSTQPRSFKEAKRVMSGVSREVVRRLIAALAPSVLLLSGCESESYPADLKYPTRTDAIVVKHSEEEPTHPDPPGHLDVDIERAKQHNGVTYDPGKLSAGARGAITESLEKHFGTPAKPFIKAKVDEQGEFNTALEELQLKEAALEEGSKLYRRHCLHCHGVSGNGRGPTGPWLNPHPRDYRKGLFKFTSTGTPTPSRDDLYRTLKNGIDYTSMPSFGLLSDRDLDHLISYVIHLALRGKAEENTVIAVLTKDVDEKKAEIDARLQRETADAMLSGKRSWKTANEAQTVLGTSEWAKTNNKVLAAPPEGELKKEDIEIGYRLFLGDGGCITCHKDFGRQSLYRYDDWGTLVQPRDLTAGNYRAGRRPIDLYWRVKGGIQPATMNAVADVLLTKADKAKIEAETDAAKKKKLTEELSDANIWRLVAFVRAAPYPAMLPDHVRREVYPVSPPK